MQGTARGGHVLTAVVAVFGLLGPAAVAAQPAVGPARVSVAAGGGISRSLHADFAGTAGAWELLAGVRLGRRVGLEVAIATTAHTEYTGRDVQVNVLSHLPAGRVTLSAGGGVGVLSLRGEHDEIASATVQAVAGVDVPAAASLSAYGRFAVVVPTRDAGASGWRRTAGARIAVWR
jgi:hypothetical protein